MTLLLQVRRKLVYSVCTPLSVSIPCLSVGIWNRLVTLIHNIDRIVIWVSLMSLWAISYLNHSLYAHFSFLIEYFLSHYKFIDGLLLNLLRKIVITSCSSAYAIGHSRWPFKYCSLPLSNWIICKGEFSVRIKCFIECQCEPTFEEITLWFEWGTWNRKVWQFVFVLYTFLVILFSDCAVLRTPAASLYFGHPCWLYWWLGIIE